MAPSKKTKRKEVIKGVKKPVIAQKTGGYYDKSPTFSFCRYDANAPWANSDDKKPTVDSVFNSLRGLESLSWREIMQASGGKSAGTNSHFVDIVKLASVAVSRLSQLSLDENQLFSMRVQNKVRLWGLIEPDGAFYVLWFDPEHKVCPVHC